MNKMEEIINDIKDYCKDNNLEIEFGVIEKNRKKEIAKALDKMLKDKETKKLEIVKKLVHNYLAVDQLMNNLEDIPYYEEFSRYGPRGVAEYMENELDSFKRCLTGAIVAMAKDEELEKFYKQLMGWEKWDDEDEDEDA